MTTPFEIPLEPRPQTFFISLGPARYQMTLKWCHAVETGWVLDIADANGAALVSGIPLVTGADLLEQHRHLSIGGVGHLYVATSGDVYATPTRDNLGELSKLLWEPFA